MPRIGKQVKKYFDILFVICLFSAKNLNGTLLIKIFFGLSENMGIYIFILAKAWGDGWIKQFQHFLRGWKGFEF